MFNIVLLFERVILVVNCIHYWRYIEDCLIFEDAPGNGFITLFEAVSMGYLLTVIAACLVSWWAGEVVNLCLNFFWTVNNTVLVLYLLLWH